MIDLNSLSDAELEAISSGNLESLSDETLTLLAGGQQQENPVAKDSTLPNLEQTELKRSGREDLLSQFDLAKEKTLNPLARAKNEMNLVGGIMQRGEAMIANPAAEMQKGNFNPKNLLDVMVEGARGKVLGEFGDLVRNTGVGGSYNEALASTTGFLAALKLGDFPTGGKLTSKIAGAEKSAVKTGEQFLSQTDQAVKDAITNKTGFLEDMQSAFYDAKSSAVAKYGEGIENLAKDNPNVSVDFKPVLENIKKELEYNPQLTNFINRVPYLKEMLDNIQYPNKITLERAQDVVNQLQSKISQRKLGGAGVRPDDIPLLDVIHDIKAQMVEAFPEIASLRKGYGDVISKFNALRGKFKGIGSDAVEKNVKTKFGGVQSEKAVKELLSESPDILQRMKNYAILRKVGKIAGGALIGGLGVVGAGAVAGTVSKLGK